MTKKIISLIIIAVFALSFASCGESKTEKSEYYEKSFFSMDTLITVRLARATDTDLAGEDGLLSDEYLASLVDSLETICKGIEAKFSRTIETSITSKLNTSADVMIDADDEFVTLLNTSLRLAELTDGAFDPTVGTLSVLWNITGGGPKPADEAIASANSHVGYRKIILEDNEIRKTDRETAVDFGGVAKGYAAQKMLEFLAESASSYGLVSVGGNVGVYGEKPTDSGSFKIGIASPDDTSAVVGYVLVGGGFVAVSGDYERYFIEDGVRYHHIFDTSTGAPAVTDIRSVAVLASSGATADALSTALFVMGSTKAMEFYSSGKISFEAVLVLADGSVVTTAGLTGGLFIPKSSE